MSKFTGFTSSEVFTQIPDTFFHLMKEIEDIAELKVSLYALWYIDHIEGHFRALREADFDAKLLGLTTQEIKRGLKKSIERSLLLKAEYKGQVYYFLNSPRGRAVAEAFTNGNFQSSVQPSSAPREKPNIFKLYEENIGPLTPLISDFLIDAEKNYPSTWFREAFEVAVSRNIRNWKYVESILARWKEKGKDERKDQQDPVKDAKRYTDSEFSEFINRD